jgi:hypothetical protein
MLVTIFSGFNSAQGAAQTEVVWNSEAQGFRLR